MNNRNISNIIYIIFSRCEGSAKKEEFWMKSHVDFGTRILTAGLKREGLNKKKRMVKCHLHTDNIHTFDGKRREGERESWEIISNSYSGFVQSLQASI